MLLKDNFSMENVQRLQDMTGRDPNLLERVVYAFGLLEAIKLSGLPFIFKGGTSLMLLMKHPMRLSTDIDIVVKPGTDIDYYIKEAAKIFPFLKCKEQVRVGKNNIEKRHFKFIYQSPVRYSKFYILLDVVFAENSYSVLADKEIFNELLLVEEPKVYVTVPTADCILGDKLTAFAPHTTGVPFGKELEIIKQLYDVANLIDVMDDQNVVADTYNKTVQEEIAYRGLEADRDDVLQDTIRSAACIIGKGATDAEDFAFYMKGIRAINNHVMSCSYSGELAAEQACKVMCLAACLLKNVEFKRIEQPENYIKANIGTTKYKKLGYMKKRKLEAYGYLVEAVQLLERQEMM